MTKSKLLSVFSLLLVLAVVNFSSCKQDEVEPDPDPIPDTTTVGKTVTITGNITKDTTWAAKDTIILSGFVYVKEGATLTIEAGTLVKGLYGTKASLVVERGAKINAIGTALKPIIFTSSQPAGQRTYGDWGGIVICGKAKCNKAGGEGIAEGGIGSTYGGTVDTDNSGSLQYVRIEFPGVPLSTTANSEINGLTFYSVGSGTTIDHVQVSYSGDDSFEFFGGTVNCKNLIALRGWDDEFDTDNGYSGTIQFAVGLRDPAQADQSGSNCFESDNDADGSTNTPITNATFSNFSVFGPKVDATTTINTQYKRAFHIRRGSKLCVYNSVFTGFPTGLLLDGTLTQQLATANELQIENTILSGMGTYFASSFERAYFTDATRNNDTIVTNDLLKYNNPFALTTPNFLPLEGSPVLNKASFTNSRIANNAFLTKVTYAGAFGTENWTANWANFDPQNTTY